VVHSTNLINLPCCLLTLLDILENAKNVEALLAESENINVVVHPSLIIHATLIH
jgi:hypothetical protein